MSLRKKKLIFDVVPTNSTRKNKKFELISFYTFTFYR